jgi:predicted phosphodiesterase
MKLLVFSVLILLFYTAQSQTRSFRFAFISDTHIGSPNGGAEEDLRRTVADINSLSDVKFVVLTGDITELGTNKELELAKKLLDSLKIKYYIIPGNHDTGWSESGGLAFSKIFGDDKFHFVHGGVHFIGCASGPYVRMSDGHVPRHHMDWLKDELKRIKKDEPVVFLNHYPLDAGLDNWYEVIDLLKQKNTMLALCGHGHNNRTVKAEGIPAVMGRSNLRAKAPEGGYNLVDFQSDSILFTERQPVSKKEKLWTKVLFEKQDYKNTGSFSRPDFAINARYPQVSAVWSFQSRANVISTPVVTNNLVVFGNQNGVIEALALNNGKSKWRVKTEGPIFSSPDTASGSILLGSTDGTIYNLSGKGKVQWKVRKEVPVLGSPLIKNGVVYIGNDRGFSAYNVSTGQSLWTYSGIEGPITSKPVLAGDKIIFGAWDRNLYALDKATGLLNWKWNNGSSVINYSPAACIPVVHDGVVYVVAPDRYLSAIDDLKRLCSSIDRRRF